MLHRRSIATLMAVGIGWASLAVVALASNEQATTGPNSTGAVDTINQWYQGLAPGKPAEQMAAQLEPLLAENAQIAIIDLDVTQTRAEFLQGLAEWHDAIDGGMIQHRVEPGHTADQVTVTACFRFTGNALMSRETFTLAQGHIISASFETIADSCDTF